MFIFSERPDERGSVLPLTAIVVAAVVLGSMALVSLVDGSVRRARAQAAADAGALAAVAEGRVGGATASDEGRAAAVRLVEANGAEVIEYRREWVDQPSVGGSVSRPLRVTIVADYLGVKAVATAERSVRSIGTGGGTAEEPESVTLAAAMAAAASGWATPTAGYAGIELGAG